MQRFTDFIKDKNCRLGIKAFIGISLLFIFCSFFFVYRLPPQIPLFYSRPWGEEQLASPYYLWLLSGGVLLIGLFNIGMAAFLFEEFSFLARILIWGNILIIIIAIIAVLRAINLVI